jgi:hypothetical protein
LLKSILLIVFGLMSPKIKDDIIANSSKVRVVITQ